MLIKKIRYFFRFLLLLFLAYHFFWESSPQQPLANTELYQLLSLQRQVDRYSPLSENNLQGTHNSFNTDVYHTLFRYHDRQQQLSLEDQLNFGARFIELDVHWTFSAWDLSSLELKQDLLLCHGSDKFNLFPFHWGCSPFDKPFSEGLEEVSNWLKTPAYKNELLILYVEDHSDEQHEYLYKLLEEYEIVQSIYKSNGCNKIPDELTKQDLIEQKKQIVLWKDGDCSKFKPLVNLAFGDLGGLLRHAEDKTFLGSTEKRYVRNISSTMDNEGILKSFSEGANIINLDNFAVNDERLMSLLWSWEFNKLTVERNGCVIQKENSKWELEGCDTENGMEVRAACFNVETKEWTLSKNKVYWNDAVEACQDLGLVFSAPTNYLENKELNKLAKGLVWLNVKKNKQKIIVGDKKGANVF